MVKTSSTATTVVACCVLMVVSLVLTGAEAKYPLSQCCQIMREPMHRGHYCGLSPSKMTCGGTTKDTGYADKCHEWNDHGLNPGGPVNTDVLQLLNADPGCPLLYLQYQCSLNCRLCSYVNSSWELAPVCSSIWTRLAATCPTLWKNPLMANASLTALPDATEGCSSIRALRWRDNNLGWGFLGAAAGVGGLWLIITFTYEYLKEPADSPPPAAAPAAAAPPPAPAGAGEVPSIFLPPPAIIKAVETIGTAKARADPLRQFALGWLAGVFIAFGAVVSVTVGKGLPNSDPGVQKFAGGAVFPVGLVLVVLCGSELITGNFACLIPGLLNRKFPWYKLVQNWVIVYIGNFLGSYSVAYFLIWMPDLWYKDPWLSGIQGVAEAKTTPGFGAQILSGIGCNILVCLAVFMAIAGRTLACKVLVIWFPIQTFVTIGYEHCVANMFFIPAGMLYGANVSFGDYLGKNLVPVTIGNLLGAAIFVAGTYWYLYGLPVKVPPVKLALTLTGTSSTGEPSASEKAVQGSSFAFQGMVIVQYQRRKEIL